jgi:hypothetical protein
MKKIHRDLRTLTEAASFSLADMAVWCNQDKSTVRGWIKFGITPHPTKIKYIRQRLEILAKVLAEGKKLPVPTEISQRDRKLYVEKVRNYALGKFSNKRTSKRRI